MTAYFGMPKIAAVGRAGKLALRVVALGALLGVGAAGSLSVQEPETVAAAERTHVTAPRPVANVPAGFAAGDLAFADSFGGSGYELLDHWNFGIASKRSRQVAPGCDRWIDGQCWSWGSWVDPDGTLHHEPWWMAGVAPYQTSYVRQNWSQDPSTEQMWMAECFVPRQVSQTSGGGTYQDFKAGGTGLRITARKAANPACERKTWESAAVNTFGKHSFGGPNTEYYVEFRAKLPYVSYGGRRITNGAWVGLWMLPSPEAGDAIRGDERELDILESGYRWNKGDEMAIVTNNVHHRLADGTDLTRYRNFDVGTDLSQGYHVYSMRVNTQTRAVSFFVDGRQYGTTEQDAPQVPMFLQVTFHVAGKDNTWQYLPRTNTSMALDIAQVRVFQRRLPAA